MGLWPLPGDRTVYSKFPAERISDGSELFPAGGPGYRRYSEHRDRRGVGSAPWKPGVPGDEKHGHRPRL